MTDISQVKAQILYGQKKLFVHTTEKKEVVERG